MFHSELKGLKKWFLTDLLITIGTKNLTLNTARNACESQAFSIYFQACNDIPKPKYLPLWDNT